MLCFFSHVVTGASSIFAIDFSMIFSWFSYAKKNDIYFRPAVCLNNKTLNSWTIPTNNRRVFNFSSSFVNFLSLLFPFFIFSLSFFPFLPHLLNNISRWYTYNKKEYTWERDWKKIVESWSWCKKYLFFSFSWNLRGRNRGQFEKRERKRNGDRVRRTKISLFSVYCKIARIFFLFFFFFLPLFFRVRVYLYACACMSLYYFHFTRENAVNETRESGQIINYRTIVLRNNIFNFFFIWKVNSYDMKIEWRNFASSFYLLIYLKNEKYMSVGKENFSFFFLSLSLYIIFLCILSFHLACSREF